MFLDHLVSRLDILGGGKSSEFFSVSWYLWLGEVVSILVIAETNWMTEIKEKLVIFTSVVIAVVVAIRDVAKYGFHYKLIRN